MEIIGCILDMHLNGVRIDLEKVRMFLVRERGEMTKLRERMMETCGERFNCLVCKR